VFFKLPAFFHKNKTDSV